MYQHRQKSIKQHNMKTRILLLLLLLVLPALLGSGVKAQSMTDDQVLSFIMKETQSGATQTDIATQLISKGVTMTQLQRVKRRRSRYASGKSRHQRRRKNRRREARRTGHHRRDGHEKRQASIRPQHLLLAKPHLRAFTEHRHTSQLRPRTR